MSKKYRATEEKQATAPITAGLEQVDGEAPIPELPGYGIFEVKDGWMAYRITSKGKVQLLNNRRNDGGYRASAKYYAIARMMRAVEDEFVYGRPVKA